jgi:hypothetical protein
MPDHILFCASSLAHLENQRRQRHLAANLCDHHLGRDQDTRVYNSWYGTTKDKKILALENAVEFAEAV